MTPRICKLFSAWRPARTLTLMKGVICNQRTVPLLSHSRVYQSITMINTELPTSANTASGMSRKKQLSSDYTLSYWSALIALLCVTDRLHINLSIDLHCTLTYCYVLSGVAILILDLWLVYKCLDWTGVQESIIYTSMQPLIADI